MYNKLAIVVWISNGYKHKLKKMNSQIEQVIKNAKAMANEFLDLGYKIVSGGTDNHLLIVDLSDKDYSGKEAEKVLEKIQK